MVKNIGPVNRVIPLAIGFALIACAIPLEFAAAGMNRLGWTGVVPVFTAAIGACPLYTLLDISTCLAKQAA